MTYPSIKILRFIYVCVFIHICDGLSWLLTSILVLQFGLSKQKIIALSLNMGGLDMNLNN